MNRIKLTEYYSLGLIKVALTLCLENNILILKMDDDDGALRRRPFYLELVQKLLRSS